MNGHDLDALCATPADRQRMERLAEGICRSLGENPRLLPSRTALAVESVAVRLSVIAGAMTVAMLVFGILAPIEAIESEPWILSTALQGSLPRAQDVYAAMSGITMELAP